MERLRHINFKKILIIAMLAVSLLISAYLYRGIIKTDGPSTDQLQNYLKSNTLQVGTGVNGDYEHVYYIFNGKRIYVTEGSSNHTWVKASGRYMVWLETPDQQNTSLVFLYDVISKNTTQLTFYGNARWPIVEGNRVVWEDHNGEKPEIYYYDGLIASKITDGKYPSVRPAIHGNQIAYAQEISTDNFQVVVYDTNNKRSEIVLTGDGTKAWPRFDGDELITDNPSY